MIVSQHAVSRLGQRGISRRQVDLIAMYGTATPGKGGIVKKAIKKRDLRWVEHDLQGSLQILDKLVGRTLVMTADEQTLITAYWSE